MASKFGDSGINEKHPEADRTEYVEDSKRGALTTVEYASSDEEGQEAPKPPTTARDLVTEVLSVEDDPTLSPWTFRMWFVGVGVSVFAGTITTINTFKPQSIHIHLVFVAVITYILGTAMAVVLPSKGKLGRILNPGPFNKKEHSAICIMVAASAATPEAMQVLAVQRLFYNIEVKPPVAIFLILSTQMLGYGVAGLLRPTLIYPSKMLYPTNLPTASLLENLHRDRKNSTSKMRVFYIAFSVLFLWQAFPQYIMPLLAGVSIFCLSMRKNLLVTNLFGGSMANEGLGFLSMSFDWSMISSHGNPLWLPFQTLMNTMVGYLIAIPLIMGLYYSNTWDANKFPFLSPNMYSHKSTAQKYKVYNQTRILNSRHEVDHDLLMKEGLPYLTAAGALGKTIMNMAITAAISHMILWHHNDLKSALEIFSPLKLIFKPKQWNFKFWTWKTERPTPEEAEEICPHYRVMLNYDEVPSWWFGGLWVLSAAIGLLCSQLAGSTLEIWAFFVAVFLSATLLIFFAALTAMFGTTLNVQPLIQMIGAYLLPGRPVANLYFATFGYNSLYQAKNMLKDLKLGQYLHLAPKATFTCQIIGTVIGCVMSYIMMMQITEEKRDILLAIQGTNVWSGQLVQSQNSAAMTWGGLAKYLYSWGARYQYVSFAFVIGIFAPVPFWVAHQFLPKLRLDYWNTAIIGGYMYHLTQGTHSGILFHFVSGFISQFWLRKYKTNWFIKYNYIMSAGIDGGAQVINFILTFAVFGAGGKVVPFPPYWGNNHEKGNYDYCLRDPALGSGKHKKKGGGKSSGGE
ncbi:OPT superfamily oligopeptide transporter [Microthyrium microscopicum]|uniref:OPT superfamily oligopeptide transporter n=1 Tax=Microthyrium microscopicum TaxID=703497 RepID=A0A6A6TXG1_9PEZI|nr:OPT superfamily oligopeptide transporter [Microthyrium microscopicum]